MNYESSLFVAQALSDSEWNEIQVMPRIGGLCSTFSEASQAIYYDGFEMKFSSVGALYSFPVANELYAIEL